MTVDAESKFIISIDRKEKLDYYTPLKSWAEVNENEFSDFLFCARNDENFRAIQRDVRIVSFYLHSVSLFVVGKERQVPLFM